MRINYTVWEDHCTYVVTPFYNGRMIIGDRRGAATTSTLISAVGKTKDAEKIPTIFENFKDKRAHPCPIIIIVLDSVLRDMANHAHYFPRE